MVMVNGIPIKEIEDWKKDKEFLSDDFPDSVACRTLFNGETLWFPKKKILKMNESSVNI